jgi:hypothetical protein
MTIFGRPVILLPHSDRPGCMDALRAKMTALTGCLGWALERVLWMVAGGVVGALVMKGCER